MIYSTSIARKIIYSFLPLLGLMACQIISPQLPQLDNSTETVEKEEPVMLKELAFQPGHPTDMVIDSKTGYVYITNGGNAIGILERGEQIAVLPAQGRRPEALAIDEKREKVYVVNSYSDSVSIIQGTEVITTIGIAGREPRGVAVEPETGWAYVVSGYEDSLDDDKRVVAGNVTVISGTEIIEVITLGHTIPTHIVTDPVNGYIYIGAPGGKVMVIKGLEEIARFDVGSTVSAMDVNHQTGEVYVLNRAIDRHLTQFRAGEFIAKLKIEDEGGVRNLQVHPTTGEVYIVDFVSQEAIIVRDMEVVGRVPLGWNPLKMDIDPISGNVYIANFSDDSVTVIQGTEVITTIDVGWYPYGIGVNPANGWVYVSNSNDDTVTILGYPEQ